MAKKEKTLRERIIEVLEKLIQETVNINLDGKNIIDLPSFADQILELVEKREYPMWVCEEGKKLRLVKEITPAEQEVLEEIRKWSPKVCSGNRQINFWQEKLKQK